MAALAGLSGCGMGDGPVADSLTRALTDAGESQTTVDLSEVVTGDWERLAFVCPYEDESTVTERLGFVWDDFPGPDMSETVALYIFIDADSVTSWAELRRSVGDPCGAGSPIPLVVPRETAVFRLEAAPASGDGPFYSLVPIAS